MTKRKPKYSGVLATRMRLYSTRDLGMAAGMTRAEVRRRNYAIMKARVQALRDHYGLAKNDPDCVLIILMGRDLGIPGCAKVALGRKRRDAVDTLSRMELVAELLEIMNRGKNLNQASIILARQLSKESPEKGKLNPASLRTRYHEAKREWGAEQIERLKTYFL